MSPLTRRASLVALIGVVAAAVAVAMLAPLWMAVAAGIITGCCVVEVIQIHRQPHRRHRPR